MSCFCRAELNSGVKFDNSTAEARRLNQTLITLVINLIGQLSRGVIGRQSVKL